MEEKLSLACAEYVADYLLEVMERESSEPDFTGEIDGHTIQNAIEAFNGGAR